MTIYDNVKERAEKAGKTIAKLEKEAGIANGTISGWKEGKPYAESLKKVADILGCSMEDLMSVKGRKKKT